MAPWTSYSLLENGESEDNLTAGRKRFLEWVQPLNSIFRDVDERSKKLRERLPFADRIGVKTLAITALVTAIIISGLVAGITSSHDETDILEYVDPLIGTAGGGT